MWNSLTQRQLLQRIAQRKAFSTRVFERRETLRRAGSPTSILKSNISPI